MPNPQETTLRAAQNDTQRFIDVLRDRNPHEPEFLQAAGEFIDSVMPFIRDHKRYQEKALLERLTEPDRIISFRVCWVDERKQVHVNRGWRVQFNNCLGPYKGGLRFHPSVNQSILKFLGFEQIFKNSLTGLPMGGAKGGANFDPKGKTDDEIMWFCYAFMVELARFIGEDTDIPAGDIGVGPREISYLFGAFKKIENKWTGALTGKAVGHGGSLIRIEATGYGCVYFCEHVMNHIGDTVEGKICVLSGAGNVAIYTLEKLIEFGAKVVAMSDSSGCLHDPDGFDPDKLAYLKDLKEVRRARISEYAERFPNATFHEGRRPWFIPCDIAFPCATQNEISIDDARALVANGVKVVCEGANMPTERAAIRLLKESGVIFAPGKAANAGGVAVSGIEQSQNALRLPWERERVDTELKRIMTGIHEQCVQYGSNGGSVDYVKGANIGGFVRVADAMLDYGVV